MRRTARLPGTAKGAVRIVFESSEMHRFAPGGGSEDSPKRGRGVHFGSEEEITEAGKELGPVELYGRTKLAMILYAKAVRDKVIRPNGDDIYMSVGLSSDPMGGAGIGGDGTALQCTPGRSRLPCKSSGRPPTPAHGASSCTTWRTFSAARPNRGATAPSTPA